MVDDSDSDSSGSSGGSGGSGDAGDSGGDYSGIEYDGALMAAAQNAAASSGGGGSDSSGDYSGIEYDGALMAAAQNAAASSGGGSSLGGTSGAGISSGTGSSGGSSVSSSSGGLDFYVSDDTPVRHSSRHARHISVHKPTVKPVKNTLALDGALKRIADEQTAVSVTKVVHPKIPVPPELQAYREAQRADFFRGLRDLSVSEMEAGIHSQSVQLTRELRRAQSAKSPVDRFIGGLKVAAEGLGLGAEEFLAGSMKLTEDLFKAPVKGAKEAIEGITSTPELLGKAASEFVKGNPLPADELAGQFLAGAAIEGGFAKAGVTTPTALSSELLIGPAGKVNTFFDRLRSGYEPELGEEINIVPAATYEPKPVEHYIDRFAGKRVTAIHMTPSDVFAKAKSGDEILLIGSSAEDASKLRRENDLRHFYQSLPTDEGKPNAYLAYVGITEKPPSEKVEFSLFPSKKVGIVTEDTVHYLKPKPGETLPEYARRQGMQSGKTMIPAENVFGASTERQVITPAAFEGNFGKYLGTKIVKVEDLGWTRYQENRLPEGLKETKLGKLLSAVGVGQRYHKIEFSKWEKIPVTEPDELEPASVLEAKKQIKKLDINEYSESYVPFREVTGAELGTRVLLGEGTSSGIERLSNPVKLEAVSPSAKSRSVKRLSKSKSKISSSANEIKAELISDEIVSQSKISSTGSISLSSRISKSRTSKVSSKPDLDLISSLFSSSRSKSSSPILSPSKYPFGESSPSPSSSPTPFSPSSHPSTPRSPHKSPSKSSPYPDISDVPRPHPGYKPHPSPHPSLPSPHYPYPEHPYPRPHYPSPFPRYPTPREFRSEFPKLWSPPKNKLFRLPKRVKREDWAVKPEITPKADWWAMTYTQAFLGLKARSPYRFDAKKRWLGDLESFGFGLTFPTKFIEEHSVRSYLDTTIEKAGLLDIVTGKRTKRKVNRAKKLSITVPPAKVGFGAGLLPKKLSGKSLKIDRTLLGTEEVRPKKRIVRVKIKPAKSTKLAKSKSRKSKKWRRNRSKKKA